MDEDTASLGTGTPPPWRGAGGNDDVPRITCALLGIILTPESLQQQAARYAGLGQIEYRGQGDGGFEVLLLREDGGGVSPHFALGVQCPGDGGLDGHADLVLATGLVPPDVARRRFQVPDADTAGAFLLAIISMLQGQGAVCIDWVDLLQAWKPGMLYGCRLDEVAGETQCCGTAAGGRVATLFLEVDIDRYELALVDTLCAAYGLADGGLVGHVLVQEGAPVRALFVHDIG